MVRRLARKGNKKAIAALKSRAVTPPEELSHLLVWYYELRRRNPRGWRFEPIAFSEIEAYGRLFELDMDPFDIDMLARLDDIWQSVQPEPEGKK